MISRIKRGNISRKFAHEFSNVTKRFVLIYGVRTNVFLIKHEAMLDIRSIMYAFLDSFASADGSKTALSWNLSVAARFYFYYRINPGWHVWPTKMIFRYFRVNVSRFVFQPRIFFVTLNCYTFLFLLF